MAPTKTHFPIVNHLIPQGEPEINWDSDDSRLSDRNTFVLQHLVYGPCVFHKKQRANRLSIQEFATDTSVIADLVVVHYYVKGESNWYFCISIRNVHHIEFVLVGSTHHHARTSIIIWGYYMKNSND